MDERNWIWFDFFQPFLMVTLAALLWPLAGWNLSREERSAYFWNFLRDLFAGFVVFFIVSGMLISCLAFIGFINRNFLTFIIFGRHLAGSPAISLDGRNEIIGLAYQIASPFLFPWYILGSLEKTLGRVGQPMEGSIPFGERTTLGVLAVLAVGFPLEGWKIVSQWMDRRSIFFLDEKILLLLLALLFIGLVRAQKGKWFGRWQGVYPKIISGLSFVLVLFSGFYHPTQPPGGAWPGDVYYSLIYAVWFAGVFAYFFLRPDAGWVKPVMTLLVLLGLCLTGPLNPENLAIKDRENVLRNNLANAGLLKDGKLVKAVPSDNTRPQVQFGWELRMIVQEDGLNWLKGAFPPELLGLDWDQQKGPANLPRLIDWLGFPPLPNPSNPSAYKYFTVRNGMQRMKNFGSYQLVDFNANLNGGLPKILPEYFLTLSDPVKYLILLDRGRSAGEIPIAFLVPLLAKYDMTDTLRRMVPPEDMFLKFENKKVEVELNFQSVMVKNLDGKWVIQSCGGQMLVRRKK